MDITEFDWPQVTLLRVEAQSDPQWAALWDVEPVFARQPPSDWCVLFFDQCTTDELIEWKGAGFARCKKDDIGQVQERFDVATSEANDLYRAYLGRVLANQPEDAQMLILMEGSLAATDSGEGYLCRINYI